jgi:hypothetical protein
MTTSFNPDTTNNQQGMSPLRVIGALAAGVFYGLVLRITFEPHDC